MREASATVAASDAPSRFGWLEEAFLEALGRTDSTHEGSYVFAGRPVLLRTATKDLGTCLRRAFGHLASSGATRARDILRIDAWEDDPRRLPVGLRSSIELDSSWIACGGTLSASRDRRYVSFHFGESVTFLDRAQQHMIACRRGGSLSGGDRSKPLLLPLSIWYHDRGVQMLHSALVAHRGSGVLLPGTSGTGKSTTAIAAFDQGLTFLADDFVGVERDGEGFLGHSIFGTACVHAESFAHFPRLAAHAVEATSEEDEKPLLYLPELAGERVANAAPIRAVVLLGSRLAHTRVSRARPAEAIREIAASTLHTVVPRPGRDALQLLGDLLGRVPSYRLQLGPDIRDLRGAVEQVVADATAADGS